MRESPLVSVIINCYNGERYLHEAIDSVLKQTYQNWEIIFWDNHSTDNSASIVKGYRNERIKYFNAEVFTGLGKARNLAVKKASGEWLAFLDCDDIWHADKLFLQVDKIKNSKSDLGLVYGECDFIVEDSAANTVLGESALRVKNAKANVEAKLLVGDIFTELLIDCFITLPSAIVNKDKYQLVGGIDDSLLVCEDYDLFLKLAKDYKVEAINAVCCFYRIHDGNLSHNNYKRTFDESIYLIRRYSSLLPAANKALAIWDVRYFIHNVRHADYKIALTKIFSLSFFNHLIIFVFNKLKIIH